MKKPNKFIVLEGVDGSGKSTQAELLVKNLQALGVKAILTREPGSPLIGLKIRDLLIDKDIKINQRTRELLFEADRAEHTSKIKELLDQGYWVVSDRSFLSGLSYSVASGVDMESVWKLMEFAICVYPSIIFYVNLDPDISKQRRDHRGTAETYEEAKGTAFMKKVNETMKSMLKSTIPQQHIMYSKELDGRKSIKELEEEIFITTSLVLGVHHGYYTSY